eukprot:CAMPEP_0113913894 /NCGR_PEP_ID=MMETSP0780_2-20120614/29922_1 /TAXON_ID=652834 /ORGANISM="Palpitomonas bilix" /LENGTH=52 /DNA_ID=CAMNT_0000911387 /DNA_START=148 /DNA_END=302 /DNA_ORIENTATION=- /assembly_acc=CAM_ASM_000599
MVEWSAEWNGSGRISLSSTPPMGKGTNSTEVDGGRDGMGVGVFKRNGDENGG